MRVYAHSRRETPVKYLRADCRKIFTRPPRRVVPCRFTYFTGVLFDYTGVGGYIVDIKRLENIHNTMGLRRLVWRHEMVAEHKTRPRSDNERCPVGSKTLRERQGRSGGRRNRWSSPRNYNP